MIISQYTDLVIIDKLQDSYIIMQHICLTKEYKMKHYIHEYQNFVCSIEIVKAEVGRVFRLESGWCISLNEAVMLVSQTGREICLQCRVILIKISIFGVDKHLIILSQDNDISLYWYFVPPVIITMLYFSFCWTYQTQRPHIKEYCRVYMQCQFFVCLGFFLFTKPAFNDDLVSMDSGCSQ